MMKRLFILLALFIPLLSVNAQSDDEIVGGTEDLQFSSQIPVAGNSVLNRMLGVQIYEQNYSKFFVEALFAIGMEDAGLGANITILPNHWGGYGSIYFMEQRTALSLGAAYRPVTTTSFLDWQLYTGAVINNGLGFEFGTRFSTNAEINKGSYACWSCSIGRMYINGCRFTTVGLSVSIASLIAIFLYL